MKSLTALFPVAALCLAFAPLAQAEEPSAFAEVLDGNLVALDGEDVSAHEPASEPKYYAFYYSAAWCPPCQAYTPELVKFYNENKNDNIEFVFISADRSEKDMKDYIIDKSMSWPALSFEKVKAFRDAFDHGVRGIPSLIVCQADGTMVGNYRGRHAELAELIK